MESTQGWGFSQAQPGLEHALQLPGGRKTLPCCAPELSHSPRGVQEIIL